MLTAHQEGRHLLDLEQTNLRLPSFEWTTKEIQVQRLRYKYLRHMNPAHSPWPEGSNGLTILKPMEVVGGHDAAMLLHVLSLYIGFIEVWACALKFRCHFETCAANRLENKRSVPESNLDDDRCRSSPKLKGCPAASKGLL